MPHNFRLCGLAAVTFGLIIALQSTAQADVESCKKAVETGRLGVGANTLPSVDAVIQQIKDDHCKATVEVCGELSQNRTDYIAGKDMARADKIKKIQDAAGCS